MILNQQLNRDKMIKEIKVTSHDLPFLTFFTSFLKIYSPGNTTWELKGLEPNGKKSLWKAISISPTSLHRILTSCQNWKQSFISQQQGKANVCWWKRVFNLLLSQNTSSFANPSDQQFGQCNLECWVSNLFSKSWFLFEISRIFQKWGRSSWLVT